MLTLTPSCNTFLVKKKKKKHIKHVLYIGSNGLLLAVEINFNDLHFYLRKWVCCKKKNTTKKHSLCIMMMAEKKCLFTPRIVMRVQ